MSERLITLALRYGGHITIPEPSWCIGHPNALRPDHPVDIGHESAPVTLTITAGGREYDLLGASLSQAPFSSYDPLPYGGVDVESEFVRMTPGEIRALADGLVEHAERLREFADRVQEVREAARAAMRPDGIPASLRWPAPVDREVDE